MAIIEQRGREFVNDLLPIFEGHMATKSKSADEDRVRQGVVVLLGTLASYLEKTDERIPDIVDTLISALTTPSEPVQQAVSRCLPPLVATKKDRGEELVERVMDMLLNSKLYSARRGAAYGLGAVVKGLGVVVMKRYNIRQTLLEAMQDKTQVKREAALMAFEMLFRSIGKPFEPHIKEVLPHLLVCFGDPKKDVRAAAQETARGIMATISEFGVKIIMPALLDALEDESWRTKQGSTQLLGAMAFCAPKQLSISLPVIVPKLAEVLTDSHAKVQSAGKSALKSIGSVIRNPEIQAIVPTILKALNDPVTYTQKCLNKLLNTAFVHIIDAPSLALIMPIVQRALKDRKTEGKKRAAQIIGSLYSLTKPKDLAPYLPKVTPGLKDALVDPLPEVRGVTAKAFGAMVKGMGEEHFAELLPWLLETLSSEAGTVDRSGAAQGLSEVLFALGVERLEGMMEGFIANTGHAQATVREGHMMLFIYLPATFGDGFKPFVSRIIPCILRSVSDVDEGVRDAAMRSGQRIIRNYADACIELLLPELLSGMLNENWRIRQSSTVLLGDLLYLLSGTSGKKTTSTDSEDDSFGTEASSRMLIDALGFERRNLVLACVYMSRQDVNLSVRQVAVHVWKVIVTHTVRSLREILPQLIDRILVNLADENEDRRTLAARTLGEMVRKLGERVLKDVFPLLGSALDSENVATRQGSCIGFGEIMASLNKDQTETFKDTLIHAVRKALCDEEAVIRDAAAVCFATLHNSLGNTVIEDILPSMLNQLEDEATSAAALHGLRSVMANKSRVVLPFLVPKLIAPPITAFNARALAQLTTVAGHALNFQLSIILRGLLEALETAPQEDRSAIRKAASTVANSVDELGISDLIKNMREALESKADISRVSAATVIADFCAESTLDFGDHTEDLVQLMMKAYSDRNSEVVHAAWGGLSAIIKRIQTDKLSHMDQIKQTLIHLPLNEDGYVAGLAIPKGLEPFMPLFSENLTKGNSKAKESAAEGFGMLLERTDPSLIKPFMLKIGGPLLRVYGEHYPRVRAAIMETICIMIKHLGPEFKGLIAQTQPTCLKTFKTDKESSKILRIRAARALSYLIVHQKDRAVDKLLNALLKQLSDSYPEDIFRTLYGCLARGSELASDETRREIAKQVQDKYLQSDDDAVRNFAGQTLGALVRTASDELIAELAPTLLPSTLTPSAKWFFDHGSAKALATALALAPEKLTAVVGHTTVLEHIDRLCTSPNASLAEAGVECASNYLRLGLKDESVTEADIKAAVRSVETVLRSEAHGRELPEAAVAHLKRAVKLESERNLKVQTALIPMLVSVHRVSVGDMKRVIDRIIIHLLDINKGNMAGFEHYCTLTNDGDAEELRRQFKRSTEKRVGENSDDEDEIDLGTARMPDAITGK
eukprot:TRINITY_DN10497_c0_g1_i2.p1 TRINITY_DN10497_c0_g1~~TRINITY_DN10497_c0_g1_i2.p1  ORF type:complete len:1451 (+),score=418.59 TRINITY_DN10497_c0_g1_i2:149-4354(+)